MPRWSVYLLRCRGGALYTGIATDVARRLREHRQGRGAKYLRGKGPLRLVFKHVIGSKGLALRVEYRIKQLPKAQFYSEQIPEPRYQLDRGKGVASCGEEIVFD